MSLRWQDQSVINELMRRIDGHDDVEAIQAIVDQFVPILEEKYPDSSEVARFERHAAARIEKLRKREDR